MRNAIHRFTLTLACLALISAHPVAAQHFDVLVQSMDGKLATGTSEPDSELGALGDRVFSRTFDSLYVSLDPGFNSIGASSGTIPPGAAALPGITPLFWDFLPMKVGGVASNLLYWNGAGATPAFGLPPSATYSLSLFGENNARAAADGTDQLITGEVIDTTAADGFIHEHRFFFLDNDHDDNNATVAAQGVYLVSMRLRMPGLDRSDPFYIAFGTPGASSEALLAAETWVTDRVNLLAPSFNADFDGDLDVDGADFLTWQRKLGTPSALQIDGDANRDHSVGAGDLAVWRNEFGSSLATMPGALVPMAASIPEPAGLVSCAIALAAIAAARRLREARHSTSQPQGRLIA